MADQALAEIIARATQAPYSEIARKRSLSGGSIHRVELVELADGRRVCVKSNRHAGDMFAQEASGLAAIEQVGQLATPRVIAAQPLNDDLQCLILEAIDPGSPKRDYWPAFGHALAEHHRHGQSARYGWSSDNYIGSNVQPNSSRDDWPSFFAECRLEFQLKLARRNGLGSTELFRMAERTISRLDRWLGCHPVQPCLVHGDLWNGNLLVDHTGHAVVIDPAVYYGDREAEMSMPLLFGGFPQAFFDAYHETWPLADEWQQRVELYKLYHLLNHLNLFGMGYLESCLEIVRRFGS